MKKYLTVIAALTSAALLLSSCLDQTYYKRVFEVYYLADTTGTSIPASATHYRAAKAKLDSLCRKMEYTVEGAWMETASKTDYATLEAANNQMDSDAVAKFATYSSVFQTNVRKVDSTFQTALKKDSAALSKENATIRYTARYYLRRYNDNDTAVVFRVSEPYVIKN
jgi:hypothetical protein